MTREQWLLALTELARPWFLDAAGLVIPKGVRASCGFPTIGARSAKVLGQCFYQTADKVPQFYIHPSISDSMRVADIAIHELIHTAMPVGVKHGPRFAKAATMLLLEGKPTATEGGEEFKRHVRPWLKQLGKYPHSAIDMTAEKEKQTTRMIKAECPECGFTFRTTRKWIYEAGTLRCPNMEAHGETTWLMDLPDVEIIEQ